MKKWLSCILLLGLCSGSVFSQALEGIEVTGKAEISMLPDQFTANFTITARAKSAEKAKAVVDHKTTLLVNSAQHLDISQAQIESTQLTINPIYIDDVIEDIEIIEKQASHAYAKAAINNPNQVRHPNKVKKQLVYQVSRIITIDLTVFEKYEKLLDKAAQLGVSRVSPLQMSFSEVEALYQQVLRQAIANAQYKGEIMAKQVRQKLGPIIYLKELSYGAPARMMMNSARAESFDAQLGEKTISAQVNARFSLID